MAERKLLLTAFCGTSAEVLVKSAELDSQYEVLYLPNDKVKDSQILIETLKQEPFDYVISLGQRPNIIDKVHIETRACKGDLSIETAFECRLLKAVLEQDGLPAKLSSNAGTSFCNELYWNGLQYMKENKLDTTMVLLHVPFEKNISDMGEFRKKIVAGLEEFQNVHITYITLKN